MNKREQGYDAVDATVFSSDMLHDPEERAVFTGYLARWNTAFGETQEPDTPPAAASGERATLDLTDTVCKALRRAFQLGQTYWQQADSESYKQNAKSADTHAAFVALLDATRAALTPAARQPSGWMPIETAPKDNTVIRLYAQGGGFYDADFNPSGSVEGFWCDGEWCGAFWDPQQDTWFRRDGIVPTHWMPLPPAPTEGESHE